MEQPVESLVAWVRRFVDGGDLWSKELGLWAALVVSAVALLPVVLIWRWRQEKGPLSHLPVPPYVGGIPFLTDDTATFLSGSRKAAAVTKRRFAQHGGKPYVTSVFGQKSVNVYTYEHVRRILGAEHDLVEVNWPSGTQQLLGRYSVSTTTFHRHVRLRKMLNSPFSPRNLEQQLPRVLAVVQKYTQWWAIEGQLEAVSELRGLTYEIMVSVMMGFDEWQADGRLQRSKDLFAVWLDGLFMPAFDIPGTAFYKAKRARRELVSMISDSVQQRQAAAQGQQPADHGPVLDTVLHATDDQGQQLSLEALSDLCLNLLFAGHDTTASTLGYGLWLLTTKHPDVVDKLREEQRQVVVAHGSDITPEALKHMKYTSAVVNELLRFQVIVPFVPRQAQRTFELDGWRIPKGHSIWVHTGHVTTDLSCTRTGPGLDPGAFNPERWLLPDAVKAAAWLPFGGGPRMCLGYPLALLELKVVLAVLARSYMWTVPQGPDVDWVTFPILRPAGGKLAMSCKAVGPPSGQGL